MAAKLYYSPFIPAFSPNGLPVPGAKLYFFLSGTDTLAPIWSDSSLGTRATNPVVANLAGRFDPVYLDENVSYRVRVVDPSGIQLGDDIDPYIPGQALSGPTGAPGAANNTYSSYAALQASLPSRRYAYLAGDTDVPARPDGAYTNTSGQVGQWVPRSQAVNIAPAALTSGGALDILSPQTVSGQDVVPSRGTIHAHDVATIGTIELVSNSTFTGNPASSWAISAMQSSNPGLSKAAGTAGSASIPVTVTPYSIYLVTLAVNTTAKGGLAIYLDGNPASNINDFPMHPIGSLTRKFYLFSYGSTGTVQLQVQAEARWAGKIDRLSLVKVTKEAPYDFFSIASDRKDFSNPFGIKFGRFLSGNMGIGDRTTQALLSNSAAWNVAFGSRANASTIDGFENTAVGCFTLEFNQMSRNSAFGYSALRSNMTGEQNTGIGYKAFVSNTTGGNNTGVGFHASLYNRDGGNNTTVGTLANYYNESGNYVTAVGSQAGINAGGDAGVYIGALSGPLRAGEFRFDYASQVCVGTESSGYGNNTTSIGRLARCGVDPTQPGGYVITTTALAVGYNAVAAQDSSVAIGGNARASEIRTVAVGEQAKASGNNTVSVGFLAESQGMQTTTIGAQAGVNRQGMQNTALGYGADSYGTATPRTNATAIGFGATTSGDNEVTLGNAAVGKLRAAVTTITAISDRRDKKNIKPIENEFSVRIIKDLKPSGWDWNLRGDIKRDGSDVGFIAQDLKKTQDDNNAQWLGLVNEANPERLEATPGRLIPVLVGALKNAFERIEALEATVKDLQNK